MHTINMKTKKSEKENMDTLVIQDPVLRAGTARPITKNIHSCDKHHLGPQIIRSSAQCL